MISWSEKESDPQPLPLMGSAITSEPNCYMEKRYFCTDIDLCCCKYYKLRFQLGQSSSANTDGFKNENDSLGHKCT